MANIKYLFIGGVADGQYLEVKEIDENGLTLPVDVWLVDDKSASGLTFTNYYRYEVVINNNRKYLFAVDVDAVNDYLDKLNNNIKDSE